MKKIVFPGFALFFVLLFAGCETENRAELQTGWPEITQENKPWTRWWWQGNAVDKEEITRLLEEYEAAGLGGFEITPIYGVRGYEEEFIDYLSPEWMEMLEHTLQEAARLDLGIDMATGTGWPFGGPWIDETEDTPVYLAYRTYSLSEGEQLEERVEYIQEPLLRSASPVYSYGGEQLPALEHLSRPVSENENLQQLALEQVRFEDELPLMELMAYSGSGEILNLTGQVDGQGRLDWTAPPGEWTLYALFRGWHGKMVERAAPGGEGFVIDHFSETAIRNYLGEFDRSFEGYDTAYLRGFFNDSYEVQDAVGNGDWTENFFEAFEEYRGYDLRNHLPALFGDAAGDENRRILHDYRETVSDLLLDTFTTEWTSWARNRNAITRNQAHGSPANILDLYAASDIPETEGRNIFRAKMASSAANVTGKKRVSSEASTWLNEHFRSSLADVKEDLDRYFLGGVNHIVYHGTAYSPEGEEWPGWLFYAAVHFSPQNPFWDHFSELNAYVARTQAFLQRGTADNDVLLYYPVHDVWTDVPARNDRLVHFSGNPDGPFEGSVFTSAAETLWNRGYGFDYISDRQIGTLETAGGELRAGKGSYKTLVLPAPASIPVETLETLTNLAREGATIVAYRGLPEDFAGYGGVANRPERFEQIINEFQFSETGTDGVWEAPAGEGRFLRGSDLERLLEYAAVDRESLADQGLEFVRRAHETGKIYFLKNRTDHKIENWVPLYAGDEVASAKLYNPATRESGLARIRPGEEKETEVYLHLHPGESVIVKTFPVPLEEQDSYPYKEKTGDPLELRGNWEIEFIDGGPVLPGPVATEELRSWTEFEGDEVKNFSGTARYSISFTLPGESSRGWVLNLGEVEKSARVKLNGEDLGILTGPVFEVYIDGNRINTGEENTLEIEVANGMANRIAYMDREGIPWKKFYNINFPAQSAENRNEQGLFDASAWPAEDSGLIGPVTVTPVQSVD